MLCDGQTAQKALQATAAGPQVSNGSRKRHPDPSVAGREFAAFSLPNLC
jgi:hypothetical protein